MFLVIASVAGVMATATAMFSPVSVSMSAMPMPTMHEDMHQGQARSSRNGRYGTTWALCSVNRK
ncbi:hypothetical protein C4K08_3164 [Pseudomonas chlororaphis subsp. aureofaciens]|nr:hypothetical protein C4K08_3164 [Pseudomonas chlororaphis subsp. aureofaciens]